MAQNKSVFIFVGKTSNGSRGRLDLRIDMNQITNLKLLGFTWKMLQGFDPHIFANARFVVGGVAKLVSVSIAVEADDSPELTL